MVLTFAISETSDAYNLVLNNGDSTLRNIMEVQGERINEEGEILGNESHNQTVSELIFSTLEVVLGQSYYSINADAQAFRYSGY